MKLTDRRQAGKRKEQLSHAKNLVKDRKGTTLVETMVTLFLISIQMAEDGYTVEKFVYREGDYTVWYTLEPKSYTVYYQDYMAGKEE